MMRLAIHTFIFILFVSMRVFCEDPHGTAAIVSASRLKTRPCRPPRSRDIVSLLCEGHQRQHSKQPEQFITPNTSVQN